MSIYIRGVDKSRKCIRCDFARYGKCVANNDKDVSRYVADAECDPACPVNQMPEFHGKLVSADLIIAQIAHRFNKYKDFDNDFGTAKKNELQWVVELIASSPAVLVNVEFENEDEMQG